MPTDTICIHLAAFTTFYNLFFNHALEEVVCKVVFSINQITCKKWKSTKTQWLQHSYIEYQVDSIFKNYISIFRIDYRILVGLHYVLNIILFFAKTMGGQLHEAPKTRTNDSFVVGKNIG
jgi:hypothetical protein